MSSQPNHAGDLDQIPGFAQTSSPEEFTHPDSSPMEGPDLTTMSAPPPPSHRADVPAAKSPGTSSPVSIDVADELENLGGTLFEGFGVVMNKTMNKRNHTPRSTLWLVSQEEAEAFGAAAARVAERHLPEELTDGDGGDALVMASVVFGYAMHNAMGITWDDLQNGTQLGPQPDAPAPGPVPTTAPPPRAVPQPQPAPQPQPTIVHAGGIETEEATPAPPDVISPLI
jgi:hypothetical protein